MTLEWTEKDARAVDTARILAADAVEKVGNGHPGTPISLAPVAYLLYQKVMNTDPADEKWIGRDRFVLSAGHASLTQYAQLYLGGLGLELGDLPGSARAVGRTGTALQLLAQQGRLASQRLQFRRVRAGQPAAIGVEGFRRGPGTV